MKEIKKEFEKWLIKQGFLQKTPKGRPGAIYEYTRNIDKVCDIAYLNHNDDCWKWLANDIYLILGFYLICKNGSVHVDGNNKGKFEHFLSSFLFHWYNEYCENVQKYFVIETGCKEDLPRRNYLFIRNFIIQSLAGTPDYELTLSLNLSKSVAHNERKALQKFYQFLKEKNYDPQTSEFLLNLPRDEKGKKTQLLKNHYIAISTGFNVFESYKNFSNLVFEFKINGGYYTVPPHVLPDETGDVMDKKEIMKLLQVSDWTLRMLHKTGELCYIKDGLYSVEDVDKYIENCFVPAGKTNKGKYPIQTKIKVWWTGAQIHKKYGITTRYIIKLRKEGKVSYLQLANRKYLYYPYSFKKYAKPNKRFARIHDKNI